jgi:hypothetical protein
MSTARAITPQQAAAELGRRARAHLCLVRETPEFKAWVAEDIDAGMHPKQREAAQHPARFKALCCSRRAGKTSVVAREIVKALQNAKRKQWVLFIAPTLDIGKDLIWAELEELHDHYQLGWTMREDRGYIETPAGAKFRIVGLDKLKQVAKLRGYDVVLFVTDETQTYEHLLQPLIDAVSPSLTGRRGTWISAGTPGPALRGFWYDVCHGGEGFTAFHWTVLDNTKNPRPGAEVLREERERRGWNEDHPTYRREWMGEWVEDANFLVCEYSSERNSIAELPADYGLHWKHVIGIDYGYVDPCAWVVLALDPYSRRTVVVHNEEQARLTNDQAADITRGLVVRYGTTNVVCDPAGGGKPFFELFNARFGKQLGCTIRPADKVNLLGSISLLNTELRCVVVLDPSPGAIDATPRKVGRMTVVAREATNLVHQLGILRWKDDRHEAVLEGVLYPDHSVDALRYALIEIAPWAVKQKPGDKTPEQRAREERAKRQQKQQARQWWDRER